MKQEIRKKKFGDEYIKVVTEKVFHSKGLAISKKKKGLAQKSQLVGQHFWYVLKARGPTF